MSDAQAQAGEVRGARGEQDGATGRGGQEGRGPARLVVVVQGEEHTRLVEVIEDEQPAGVRFQPGFDGLHDQCLLSGILLRQIEPGGDVAVGAVERLQGIGAHPEDGAILLAVAIGVFDGELGFADAAQATDGLHLADGDALAAAQLHVNLSQLLLARGEERIARERDIPGTVLSPRKADNSRIGKRGE